MKLNHVCDKYFIVNNDCHKDDNGLSRNGRGRLALSQYIVLNENNEWEAGNYGYGVLVKYCPWCGVNLHVLRLRYVLKNFYKDIREFFRNVH